LPEAAVGTAKSTGDQAGELMSATRADTLSGLVVDALASYRLVKLVRDDRIFEPVRETVVERQGPPERSKLSYLLNCPWCLSFYVGGALTLCRGRWPDATEAVARTLALSALTGLASQHLDQHPEQR
jgi:Protein of unknown function (DUF1360)